MSQTFDDILPVVSHSHKKDKPLIAASGFEISGVDRAIVLPLNKLLQGWTNAS